MATFGWAVKEKKLGNKNGKKNNCMDSTCDQLERLPFEMIRT